MRRPARRRPLSPSWDALEGRTLLSSGGLLVRFNGGMPSPAARAVLRDLRATITRSFEQGPSLVTLGPGVDASRAALRLSAARGVLYAEPDGTIQVDAALPFNDPRAGELWGLNNPNDVDIDAAEAWSITTGVPATVVAVIDSGFDLSHPDLFNKVWVNPGEIAGNGVDDDRDGKIDDVFGWNFLDNTPDIRDFDGHGTHISGTIAGVANNGVGVTGVAPGVRIMPLKFIGDRGDGAISDAVSAIHYAVAHGARVINASWGSNEYSQSLADAIRYAGSRDVVFVTAAGNQAANNDRIPNYPPNVASSNVLSVAAIDSTGALASFSNYGPRMVDLAAPGVGILSTVLGGGYARYSGTSMSTPHVAGVAALILSRSPGRSADQVVQTILSSVKPLPTLTGRILTGGVVDAYRALLNTPAPGAAAPEAPGSVISLGATLSDDDARSIVLGSDAYHRLKGGTRPGFLRGLYRDVLGKRLDAGSQFRWSRQMRRGLTRQQVARAVLATAPAQRLKVAGWLLDDLGGTVSAASLSNRPDVTGWAGLLASGASDSDVHAAILGSAEYRATAGGTAEGFVVALYADLLDRLPGPEEQADAIARLRAGGSPQEIARGLLASLEARQVRVARWFQRDLKWSGALNALRSAPDVAALAAQIRA
jgi:subtilisin family serine protease